MSIFGSLGKIFIKNRNFIDRRMCREFYELKAGLERNIGNIDTLILGSSHGAFGIKAENIKGRAFNLSMDSEDLYYSYMLLKKYINEAKSLKHIIITYSVFSRGFELDKVKSEIQKCYFYEIIYKILPKTDILEDKALINDIKKYIKIEIERFFMPIHFKYRNMYGDKFDGTRNFMSKEIHVADRVKSHVKHYRRSNVQDKYLVEIINICKMKGIDLKVVIPPVHKLYRGYFYEMSENQKIVDSLSFVGGGNLKVQIINFFDDDSFIENDFGDYDHLNETGANKLTLKMNNFMGKI